MVSLKPKLFATAVAGAAVFALLTVASSFAFSWVIDNVVIPRFEEGDVELANFLTGIGLIIGIGLVRSVAIVVRRSYASITQWRVAQVYTDAVVDRYARPTPRRSVRTTAGRSAGTPRKSPRIACPSRLASWLIARRTQAAAGRSSRVTAVGDSKCGHTVLTVATGIDRQGVYIGTDSCCGRCRSCNYRTRHARSPDDVLALMLADDGG
jgi:hypothetical protein